MGCSEGLGRNWPAMFARGKGCFGKVREGWYAMLAMLARGHVLEKSGKDWPVMLAWEAVTQGEDGGER